MYIYNNNFDTKKVVFFSSAHLFCLFGLIRLFVQNNKINILTNLLIWHHLGAIGITAGSHRLWSHRSYKAKMPLQFFLMILTSIANQGTIIHWVRDHRCHHKFSDTEKDPHNSNYGFFYSHIGWLLIKKPKEVIEAGKNIDISDILNNPVLKFQNKLHPYWNLIWCFIIPSLYGRYLLSNYIDSFLIFGIVRWVFLLHSTWCINSVAHIFGYKPYKDIPPSQSFISSILSCGEGWHNFHHVYPYDYSAAEHGFLYEWNPTKLFIDFFYLIGQVTERKKVTIVKKF
jgi:stearoyl-CoA desaturase (delta-9 desaturase)